MNLISHEPADKDYFGPWCHAEVECPMCGQEQVSVYPMVCMELQCAGCLMMMPAPVVEAEMGDFQLLVLPLCDRNDALALGVYYASQRLRHEHKKRRNAD